MSNPTTYPPFRRVCEICNQPIIETIPKRPGRPRKYHSGDCAKEAQKIQHIRWANRIGMKIFKTERAKK